jgi:hypothetical protein
MSAKKTKKVDVLLEEEKAKIADNLPNTDIWQQSDEQIKQNLFFATTAKEVYRLVFCEGTPITKERIALAQGLMALRTYDMQAEIGTDAAISRAIRECRETVFTSMIFACIKNGVCMSDSIFVMNALNTEAMLLPVWDYTHAEQSDQLSMGPPGHIEAQPKEISPEAKKKMKEVFDSLGIKQSISDSEESDDLS